MCIKKVRVVLRVKVENRNTEDIFWILRTSAFPSKYPEVTALLRAGMRAIPVNTT